MAKILERNIQKNDITLIFNSKIGNSNGANGTKMKRKRRSVQRDSPPQRSSIYRGVTRHRWTGRYEAHLWDKNCWNESQNKKGRQVYLGAYDDEEVAAHAYDLAALKYWGSDTILNFPLSTYEKELKEMEGLSREEYIGSLRRKSSGFSRGVSKYRGVARHHHNGRWEARIGRVFGNKYLYLGTYATQEEAATAYDIAAIEYRGLNAVTNFDLSRYIKWLKPRHNDQDNLNPNHMINISNLDVPNDINHHQFTISNNIQQANTNTTTTISDHNSNDQTALGLTQQQSCPPRNSTSALGLLLQSSKYKEMVEMTTSSSSSSSSLPSSFSAIPYHDHGCYFPLVPRPVPDESDYPNSLHHQFYSFPEDIIQTNNAECDQNSSSFPGGDDDVSIFGDLNSLLCPPLFQCGFDI